MTNVKILLFLLIQFLYVNLNRANCSLSGLPDEILIKIYEYVDDLNMRFISKNWYRSVEESVNHRIRQRYSREFREFLSNWRSKIPLKRAMRLDHKNIYEDIFPVVKFTWQRQRDKLIEIDDVNEWFELLIESFGREIPHIQNQVEKVMLSERYIPRINYVMASLKLPGRNHINAFASLNRLRQAIVSGDMSSIQTHFLTGRTSSNLLDCFGDTPLTLAISLNDVPIVAFLLGAGAAASYPGTDTCFSPLHMAVIQQNHHILRLLLEHGADPNSEDVNGETALSYALLKNNQTIIALLLSNGATYSNTCFSKRSRTGFGINMIETEQRKVVKNMISLAAVFIFMERYEIPGKYWLLFMFFVILEILSFRK